jgi:hypothetical protein
VIAGRDGDLLSCLFKFNPISGALSMDESFRDSDEKPGFNFSERGLALRLEEPAGRTAPCFPAENMI